MEQFHRKHAPLATTLHEIKNRINILRREYFILRYLLYKIFYIYCRRLPLILLKNDATGYVDIIYKG